VSASLKVISPIAPDITMFFCVSVCHTRATLGLNEMSILAQSLIYKCAV